MTVTNSCERPQTIRAGTGAGVIIETDTGRVAGGVIHTGRPGYLGQSDQDVVDDEAGEETGPAGWPHGADYLGITYDYDTAEYLSVEI